MKTAITATKARQNFFKLLDQVDSPGSSVTITMDGEPRVVMMPIDDFEGWQETLEIISDKKLLKSLKKAREDVKSGRVYSEEEVKKRLKL